MVDVKKTQKFQKILQYSSNAYSKFLSNLLATRNKRFVVRKFTQKFYIAMKLLLLKNYEFIKKTQANIQFSKSILKISKDCFNGVLLWSRLLGRRRRLSGACNPR